MYWEEYWILSSYISTYLINLLYMIWLHLSFLLNLTSWNPFYLWKKRIIKRVLHYYLVILGVLLDVYFTPPEREKWHTEKRELSAHCTVNWGEYHKIINPLYYSNILYKLYLNLSGEIFLSYFQTGEYEVSTWSTTLIYLIQFYQFYHIELIILW